MDGPVSRVICTLGMHRSGTSLVSRLLNLLGVQLGPHEMLSRPLPPNPKGYWEHWSFVGVNDTILDRFGGSWDRPPDFPAQWWRGPGLDDLRQQSRDFIAQGFASEPLWGWKDPRNCLTLPFWQDLVGPMRYVICVRNPCGVAASLAARDSMSAADADRLWFAHTDNSLAQTDGHPRIVVFYEDVIRDWPAQLRRLAAFIGEPARAEDPKVRDAAGAFVERELCHHLGSIEELIGDARISVASRTLYLSLLANRLPGQAATRAAAEPRTA